MSPARSHFALWTSVKVIVAAILVFILAGLAIPNLVNAHNTALLLLAIVLGFATLALVGWTALSVRRDWRRLHAAGTDLIEARK